jgi:integrase
MYLAHRGNTWHFSRRLPNDSAIRPGSLIILSGRSILIGKNGYVRFSLETTDKREALRRSRMYAAELDTVIESNTRRQETTALPITDRDIQRGARLMQATLLAADETQYKKSLAAALAGDEAPQPPDREQDIAAMLPPASVAGDAQLLQQLRSLIPFYVLQATGKLISGNLSDYGDRLIPFVQAWRNTAVGLSDRAEGKTVITPPDPRNDPVEGARLDWDELLAYYEQQHPDLAVRTCSLYKLALGELATFAKCDPIELKRVHVVEWHDTLLTHLKAKTVLTRLNAAGSVYRYALSNEKLGERSNPFNGVTVAGAKSATSSRKGFELATLKAVLDPLPPLSEIPASAGAHAALWIPLLALFTGARRGELAGLMLDEVGQDENGIWYLHFRLNALRKLKTGVSERFVPLHKELVTLGFPEYIKAAKAAGVSQLFPGIANPDSIGEWFSDFVRSRIGQTDVMQDLHSFRHTFKTATRNAALVQEIHDAITGHATPGVSAQYGDRAGLPRVKLEIDKIGYPDLVLQPPPQPTKDELKLQEIATRRRLISGQRRRVKGVARAEAKPRRGGR